MNKKISFIGGDLITIYLMKGLLQDGYEIKTYLLEEADNILGLENLSFAENLEEIHDFSEIIVYPMPIADGSGNISASFTKRKVKVEYALEKMKNKTLIAGKIPRYLYSTLEKNNVDYYDITKSNELRILSAISTAEGVLKIAIEETNKTIHGTNVLIMGFGRAGKMTAKVFSAVGAKVSCEARRTGDLAWVKAMGYDPIHLTNLGKHINKFDIIINTIPYLILDADMLDKVKKDVLIIDIAKDPPGLDRKAARERNIKNIWALSIPEKVAPETYAQVMKKATLQFIEEHSEKVAKKFNKEDDSGRWN